VQGIFLNLIIVLLVKKDVIFARQLYAQNARIQMPSPMESTVFVRINILETLLLVKIALLVVRSALRLTFALSVRISMLKLKTICVLVRLDTLGMG
jgi:hypothetical protein